MTSRRWRRSSGAGLPSSWSRRDRSPHDPERDESFASLPDLIVIDGGKGQLSAGMRALEPLVERGSAVISLAKKLEQVYVPGASEPVAIERDSEGLRLLQRVRDEAHRFAITHHRGRRDKAMTASLLDDLRGVGPARKRALLEHFGSPERDRRRQPRGDRGGSGAAGQARPRHPSPAQQGRMSAGPAGDGDGRLFDRPVELYVITGYSGAGKSEAIAAFEDSGFFCVDNLPPRMIAALGELFRHDGLERSPRRRRHRRPRRRLLHRPARRPRRARRRRARSRGCSSSRPPRRRSSTASRRPAAGIRWRPTAGCSTGSAPSARCSGRCASGPTSSSTPPGSPAPQLRRKISADLLGPSSGAKLALTILTFGFKKGPPRDADLVFDVRFLPNPYYRDHLRPLTGRDAAVVEYVESGELAGEYYARLLPLLDFLLPAYLAEGKSHLTLAIGCTGGRHRSITVADRVARHLASARRGRDPRRPPRRRPRVNGWTDGDSPTQASGTLGSMPTSKPRYQITDTGPLSDMLDLAEVEWPDAGRKELLVRLAELGHERLLENERQALDLARRQRQRLALERVVVSIDVEALLDDAAWR